MAAPSLDISYFDRPILITGCARSRTSMVAGVLNHCGVWFGDCFGAAPGNPKGFYENKLIREHLVKQLLKEWDVDPLGVFPLPPYKEGWGSHLYDEVSRLLSAQDYNGEMWAYKGAKMAYMWPTWVEAFPNAKWVIVRRDKEEIINSCLKTPFMAQHSQERQFWEKWVEATEERLEELKQHVDHFEVWPPDNLKEMVEWCGAEWTEEANEFVENPYSDSNIITQLNTENPLPKKDIQERIKENNQRENITRVFGKHPHSERMIIVGGGPSLKKNLDHLRRKKGYVLATNGVHDYLIEKGIKPWGMIIMDPRSDMTKFVQNPQKDVRYYVAAHCHPDVFDALEGYDVRLWNAAVGADEQEILSSMGIDYCLIGGGSTAGMRAFHVGMVEGFRNFHCFGMDSCLDGNEHHAYEQTIRGSGLENVVKIHMPGKDFWGTGWMYAQCRDFNDLLKYHGHYIRVRFTGGGALSYLASIHPNRL